MFSHEILFFKKKKSVKFELKIFSGGGKTGFHPSTRGLYDIIEAKKDKLFQLERGPPPPTHTQSLWDPVKSSHSAFKLASLENEYINQNLSDLIMRNCYTYNKPSWISNHAEHCFFDSFFLFGLSLAVTSQSCCCSSPWRLDTPITHIPKLHQIDWYLMDIFAVVWTWFVSVKPTGMPQTNAARYFFFFFYRVLCSPKWAIRFDFHPKFWRKNKTPEIRVIIGRAFKKKKYFGGFPIRHFFFRATETEQIEEEVGGWRGAVCFTRQRRRNSSRRR